MWLSKAINNDPKGFRFHKYTLPSKEELCISFLGSTFGITSGEQILTTTASRLSCRVRHGIPTFVPSFLQIRLHIIVVSHSLWKTSEGPHVRTLPPTLLPKYRHGIFLLQDHSMSLCRLVDPNRGSCGASWGPDGHAAVLNPSTKRNCFPSQLNSPRFDRARSSPRENRIKH
jgi:hypothetical protein